MSHPVLLAEQDIDWIAEIVDVVERSVGQPWRDAIERLDDLQRSGEHISPRRFSAVVSAVQRLSGGRVRNTRAAREARGLILGMPVFTPDERRARIAAAAEHLATTPAAVETLLWADLPRERPVELPSGRPCELEVAAFANVHLIQRTLRRAQMVRLVLSSDPGPLLRAAAVRGLLTTATQERRTGVTRIEIVGPLALCHRTSVYGRALAELVPLLGGGQGFALEVRVETQTAVYTTTITSPVLLPAADRRLAATPHPVAILARTLARHSPDLVVTASPPPLSADDAVLVPDLIVERGAARWYIELVGFWTAAYLRAKHARYRSSGRDVLLCIDSSGGNEPNAPLEHDVICYSRRVDPQQIIDRMDGRVDGGRDLTATSTALRVAPRADPGDDHPR